MTSKVRRGMNITRRIDLTGNGGGRRRKGVLAKLFAHEQLGGAGSLYRSFPDAQEHDSGRFATTGGAQSDRDCYTYEGIVAMAARHFLKRPTTPNGRGRKMDLDEQLVGPEIRREKAREELLGFERTPPPWERIRKRAPKARQTAGSSAAGSAWARLPPKVPRLRI